MLYQYTDANAVKSIIENNEIWMTNIRFLNDKEEFKIGLNYLQHAFETLYEFPDSISQICIEQIKKHFVYHDHAAINFDILNNSLYVASFSYAPDLLSQWRGYGMYAVGFDPLLLSQSGLRAIGGDLLPLDCYYVEDDKDALAYAHKMLRERIDLLPVD